MSNDVIESGIHCTQHDLPEVIESDIHCTQYDLPEVIESGIQVEVGFIGRRV